MSAALQISLQGQLPEPLQRVIAERGGLSATALQAVGSAAAKEVRTNFRALPGNRLGGQRYFWAGAVKGTSHAVGGSDVVVTTNQIGVNQRLRGGTIRPVKAKWLVFPIAAESYGKTPADFGWVRGKKTSPEVRDRLDQLFGRARKVTQRANPDALPSDERVSEVSIRVLLRHFKLGGAA